MSAQPPSRDDPLASLAKAAEKAVQSGDASRAADLQAREAASSGKKRLVRVLSIVALAGIAVAALIVQGPRMADPYYDVDPLADPKQARAYVAALLDAVWEWRAHNHGWLPTSLEQAVPQSRLPPAGSPYKLEYRIEGDVPVLTLRGGREPLVVRGAGK